MQSYTTSRSIFSFVEFVSWVAVVLGVIGAIAAFSIAADSGFRQLRVLTGLMAAAPFVVLSFLGLLSVLFVQVGRANVDTAKMTGQMLLLARKQTKMLEASYSNRDQTLAAGSERASKAAEQIDWPVPDEDKKRTGFAKKVSDQPADAAEPVIQEASARTADRVRNQKNVNDWPAFGESNSTEQNRVTLAPAKPEPRPVPPPLAGNPSVVWPIPAPATEEFKAIAVSESDIEISDEEFESLMSDIDQDLFEEKKVST